MKNMTQVRKNNVIPFPAKRSVAFSPEIDIDTDEVSVSQVLNIEHKNLAASVLTGGSQVPGIKLGSMVFIDTSRSLNNGDIALYFSDDKTYVRRFAKQEASTAFAVVGFLTSFSEAAYA